MWITRDRYNELVDQYFAAEVEWSKALTFQRDLHVLGGVEAHSYVEKCLQSLTIEGIKGFLNTRNLVVGGVRIGAGDIADAAMDFGWGQTSDTERKIALFSSRRERLQNYWDFAAFRWGNLVQVPEDLAMDVPATTHGLPLYWDILSQIVPFRSVCD